MYCDSSALTFSFFFFKYTRPKNIWPKSFGAFCAIVCDSILVYSFIHRHVLNVKCSMAFVSIFSYFSLLQYCNVVFFSICYVRYYIRKENKTPPQNNFTVLQKYWRFVHIWWNTLLWLHQDAFVRALNQGQKAFFFISLPDISILKRKCCKAHETKQKFIYRAPFYAYHV